jgi:hypothetical protein
MYPFNAAAHPVVVSFHYSTQPWHSEGTPQICMPRGGPAIVTLNPRCAYRNPLPSRHEAGYSAQHRAAESTEPVGRIYAVPSEVLVRLQRLLLLRISSPSAAFYK